MRPAAAVVLVLVALGTGCGEAPTSDLAAVLDALPQEEPDTTLVESDDSTPTPTTTAARRECERSELATRSLVPTGDELGGDAIAAIRERGRLRVGLDENTLGFAARDPRTGDIEGFEVELAEAIAARIFGGDGAQHVETVPVVTNDKLSLVEAGHVDMTISANSMSCQRWERVAFSTEYYTAHQQFLVRREAAITSVDDLARATVCVTTNSSSIGILEEHVPGVIILQVPDRTGCLLLLQEGDVDAYFGHDSFLYGMIQQDPTMVIRDLLPPEVTVSHYGIAVSHDHPELVRFVNAVLEELRNDGTWADLHEDLERIGVPAAEPPPARYRD